MDTDEVLARFESERQAQAVMDPPNIAHALEAGATDEGLGVLRDEISGRGANHRRCDRYSLGAPR